MARLSNRERILNAWAAGFHWRWIAKRFGLTRRALFANIAHARGTGDPRATYCGPVYWPHSVRWRLVYQQRGIDARGEGPVLFADEFPDLPEVSDRILPWPPSCYQMDETAYDRPRAS